MLSPSGAFSGQPVEHLVGELIDYPARLLTILPCICSHSTVRYGEVEYSTLDDHKRAWKVTSR